MDINATHFRTCDILQALARPCLEEHPLAHMMTERDDVDDLDLTEDQAIAPEEITESCAADA